MNKDNQKKEIEQIPSFQMKDKLQVINEIEKCIMQNVKFELHFAFFHKKRH